jgi:prepilin-type N-terminal cleavage/methylation domain-containing protein
MLKSRGGFTLIEVLVALTITAIIGAAVTGVFITQSRFFDHQEKTDFARGVSRGAMNIIVSELRMVERGGGVVSAAPKKIVVRAPYRMAVTCGIAGVRLAVSRVPSDTSITNNSRIAGYAYRNSDTGAYTYVPTTTNPNSQQVSNCTSGSPVVTVIPTDSGGGVIGLMPAVALPRGTPVLLYQEITYEFAASTSVQGRTALWRQVTGEARAELVAPFDTTARFRFYVNDAATAVDNAPTTMSDLTGFQLVLDGMSERPNRDGSVRRVPLETAVFFRNR